MLRSKSRIEAEHSDTIRPPKFLFSDNLLPTGTGAYALVKHATHSETGNRVAVKIVKLSEEAAEAAGVSARLSGSKRALKVRPPIAPTMRGGIC